MWYRIFLAALIPAGLMAQESGSIDGRVTNAITGEAIEGATVELTPRGHPAISTTHTAADGTFRFDGVGRGAYWLVAQHAGFASSNSAGPSKPITIDAGQQLSNLTIQLTPEGTISGKVTDENGEPVSKAQVRAFTAASVRGKILLRQISGETADTSGAYTLKNLPPDKYYIVSEMGQNAPDQPNTADQSQPDHELVRTFYPKSPDRGTATSIDLAAGQNLADTNITMLRSATYHIRGKVVSDQSGGWSVALVDRNEPVFSRTKPAKPDGSFDVDRVAPGSYVLNAHLADSRVEARSPEILAQQNVDVSSANVDAVVLSPATPVTLTGQVTIEGLDQPRLSQIRITLRSVGETIAQPPGNIAVKADGSFQVPNVGPGEYTVQATGGPTGSYIKSITFNRRDITNSSLDLSEAGAGEIDVVFRMGAAEVDGTVQISSSLGNARPPAITILLFPDTMHPDGTGMLFGYAGLGGTFAIKNVPPGHYTAFAVERWNTIWLNPDFLSDTRRQGTSLDAEENGHPQIQLPLLTVEQVQEEAARLGLAIQ